ncbi:Hypothetical predicted protein, partial [Paramuricea clavata]
MDLLAIFNRDNATINIEDTNTRIGQKFMTRPSTVVTTERSLRSAPQENFSSRKRALSSDETSQPPTKRLNTVLAGETPVINCRSDVIPAVSRGLATVEACNQATLQKPRDV